MSNVPLSEETAAELCYEFGPFRLDSSHTRLVRDGEEIQLPPKVLETLLLFVQSPGRILTRESLLERLWPDTVVSDTSLTQNIWLLRKALGDEKDTARYIETIPRRGYRFVADVVVVAQQTRPSNVVMMRTMSGRLTAFTPVPRPRSKWLLIASAVALMIIAAAAAVWIVRQRAARQARFRERVVAAKQRPAVAPVLFRNETRNPAAAWLRTAIPRMLADELSAGERVRTLPGEAVTLMTSDLALPESDGYTEATLARIHDYSGADLVLIGSFVAPPSSTQLRFTARVQDIESGETIASASAEGSQEELFELVRRAGGDLRDELGLTMIAGQPQRAAAPAPASLEAARLYASGIEKLNRYELVEARDVLLRAAAADPAFAQTHRALSDVWFRLGYDKRAAEEARLAAERMGNLPRSEQLQIEAMVAQTARDWPKLIEIRQSLWRFYPDHTDYGLDLVTALSYAGKLKDALAVLDRLQPGAPEYLQARIGFYRAVTYVGTGDFNLALTAARSAVTKARRLNARILLSRARLTESMAMNRLGDKQWRAVAEDSLAVARSAGFKVGELRTLLTLSSGSSDAGSYDEALAILQRAEILANEVGDVRMQFAVLLNRAYVLADMERYDEALALSDRALVLIRAAADRTNEAIMLSNRAEYFAELGRYDEALQSGLEALAVNRELDRKVGLVNTLTNLAAIERHRGGIDRAAAYVREAAPIAAAIPGQRPKLLVREEQAAIAQARGSRAEARKLWAELAAAWTNLEEARKTLTAKLEIARIDLASGRRADALREATEVRTQAEAKKMMRLAREAGDVISECGGSAAAFQSGG